MLHYMCIILRYSCISKQALWLNYYCFNVYFPIPSKKNFFTYTVKIICSSPPPPPPLQRAHPFKANWAFLGSLPFAPVYSLTKHLHSEVPELLTKTQEDSVFISSIQEPSPPWLCAVWSPFVLLLLYGRGTKVGDGREGVDNVFHLRNSFELNVGGWCGEGWTVF